MRLTYKFYTGLTPLLVYGIKYNKYSITLSYFVTYIVTLNHMVLVTTQP